MKFNEILNVKYKYMYLVCNGNEFIKNSLLINNVDKI